MKQAIIILTLFLFSCSKDHETKQVTNIDSSSTKTESKINPFLRTEFVYENLSNEFNIKVTLTRFKTIDEYHDSCIVKLTLKDKLSQKIIDSLKHTSIWYLGDVFVDSSNVLSYTTKVNVDREISDNFFGDLVIADLNFDNKEDIAVMSNSGGNGGPSYNFYLQDSNKKFILNDFLTDSMNYFPTKINSKKNTLVTYAHAGVCWLGEQTYQLDKGNGKWTKKSHKKIDICKK